MVYKSSISIPSRKLSPNIIYSLGHNKMPEMASSYCYRFYYRKSKTHLNYSTLNLSLQGDFFRIGRNADGVPFDQASIESN